MPEPAQSTRYLDPAALAKLKDLGLAARLVAEGLLSGQHRSPHSGFFVEFPEHRQYTPGIDPRMGPFAPCSASHSRFAHF